MPTVDFNWHEGEESFERPTGSSKPLPDSAFARPQLPKDVAEEEIIEEEPGPGLFRASNLLLLLVGIILGLAVGFGILTFQGQRNARADLAPVVELQFQALAQNDQDLYNSLIDPSDQMWREVLAGAFPISSLMYDLEGRPPRVRGVEIKDDVAEVEIDANYLGQPYRRIETMRLVDEQWRLSRSRPVGWGDLVTQDGEHVVLRYRERDAFLGSYLDRIDDVVKAFCDRYNPPPPCRLDLRIEPNPDLLPFLPGEGATPPAPVLDYIILGGGSSGYITVNGTGDEIRDSAFQERLLSAINKPETIKELYVNRAANADALAISANRQGSALMPLEVVSPRLVGVNGDTPHPVWWLALHEAIGDVIMRRALGPVTASQDAAYTVWAIARGDVAIWAERLSGVQLPDVEGEINQDPAVIGKMLLEGDTSQRNAARALTLFLHSYDTGQASAEADTGELATLSFLTNAKRSMETPAIFAELGLTLGQLKSAWQARLSTR